MGPALFLGLVACVVVVVAFAIYGVFLGMGRLADRLRGMWKQVMAEVATAEGRDGDNGSGQANRRGCWEIKGCTEAAQRSCPARARPELPCWLANMQGNADGRLSPNCLTCQLFSIPALMTGR